MTVANVNDAVAAPNSTVQPKAPQSATDAIPKPPARAASSAEYSTPTTAIDGVTGAVIIEYRNTTSGEEISQIPSRAALEYEQSQKLATTKSGVKPDDTGR
jgi:hypothetical protein